MTPSVAVALTATVLTLLLGLSIRTRCQLRAQERELSDLLDDNAAAMKRLDDSLKAGLRALAQRDVSGSRNRPSGGSGDVEHRSSHQSGDLDPDQSAKQSGSMSLAATSRGDRQADSLGREVSERSLHLPPNDAPLRKDANWDQVERLRRLEVVNASGSAWNDLVLLCSKRSPANLASPYPTILADKLATFRYRSLHRALSPNAVRHDDVVPWRQEFLELSLWFTPQAANLDDPEKDQSSARKAKYACCE